MMVTVTLTFQMADIPMDENLASILISGQYILGYLFSSIAMLRF